jgi:hypothetical protein
VPARSPRGGSVGDVVELVKAYVKQETLGPLKGAGRWLALGLAGAVCIGIGLVELSVALLRVLQEETGDTFDGNWSWVPYVITLVFVLVAMGITLTRIQRATLQRKEDRR